MPYSGYRIRKHIKDEVFNLAEKCPGYRDALEEAIGKILGYEEDNQIQTIPIQQKVNEVFFKTGEALYSRALGLEQGDAE